MLSDTLNDCKISSFNEACDYIQDHCTIVTSMAASEPQVFYKNAALILKEKKGLKLYCANPSKSYEIFENEALAPHVEIRPMFLTSKVRYHQKRKHIHYVPQHLSQWVDNILDRQDVDIFWGSCSVPDKRGFVSLGPSACYESAILKKAKKVILEINENIPFTFGATCIPCHSIDTFIFSNEALPTYDCDTPDQIDFNIAKNVADLVPNGSTLQLGIGSIPNALASALKNKKDLGIHTEMINDAILELYKSGALTGRRKTLWPDKIIGAFAYGSPELYQFIDKNPLIELHPASIVNDPQRIGRNHQMISINSAVEIDITGQVCSESIGHLELSGVGGATDTHVGAQRSQGGKGIIALKSRTKKNIAKIVSELKPGAKISLSRNDIDTVVTEYGAAPLKGRTVAERAKNLISIAHPSHRESLLNDAKKFGYI